MAHVLVSLFLRHFDIICDLLLNRRMVPIFKEVSSGTYKTYVYLADK